MSEGRSAIDVIRDPKNRPVVKTVLTRLEDDIKAESSQHNVQQLDIELCVWLTLTRVMRKQGVPAEVLHGLVEFADFEPEVPAKPATVH